MHDDATKAEDPQSNDTSEPAARIAVRADFIAGNGDNWRVIGASVAGIRHLREGRPCQDYCSFSMVGEGCGLIVVADGAGSALHGDIGSELVAKDLIPSAVRRVLATACGEAKRTPSDLLSSIDDNEWKRFAASILAQARDGLREYASKENMIFADLAATLICCILVSDRLLVMHVGDGRGTYRDKAGNWRALFEPVLGRNAGETVFLTAPLDEPEMSTLFFRSHLYECRTDFVAIVTDGCEKGTFELHRRIGESETDERYSRANVPHPGFFNALPEFTRAVLEQTEPEVHWVAFLNQGVEQFKQEYDDKTMVVALRQ
jgi:hypothetical protein